MRKLALLCAIAAMFFARTSRAQSGPGAWILGMQETKVRFSIDTYDNNQDRILAGYLKDNTPFQWVAVKLYRWKNTAPQLTTQFVDACHDISSGERPIKVYAYYLLDGYNITAEVKTAIDLMGGNEKELDGLIIVPTEYGYDSIKPKDADRFCVELRSTFTKNLIYCPTENVHDVDAAFISHCSGIMPRVFWKAAGTDTHQLKSQGTLSRCLRNYRGHNKSLIPLAQVEGGTTSTLFPSTFKNSNAASLVNFLLRIPPYFPNSQISGFGIYYLEDVSLKEAEKLGITEPEPENFE